MKVQLHVSVKLLEIESSFVYFYRKVSNNNLYLFAQLCIQNKIFLISNHYFRYGINTSYSSQKNKIFLKVNINFVICFFVTSQPLLLLSFGCSILRPVFPFLAISFACDLDFSLWVLTRVQLQVTLVRIRPGKMQVEIKELFRQIYFNTFLFNGSFDLFRLEHKKLKL